MKVAFEAQIMQNNIKSLRSMDKEARLLLEYKAEDDELISNINKLHSAENTVMVMIMDKKEDQERVWQGLNELSPEFREILVMKYIQDKRYDEISEILSIPRGTVMSRLYYARKAFHKVYIKLEETEALA